MKRPYKHYDLELESKSKMRKADTSSVKNVVSDLLNVYKIKDKFGELELIAAWEEITNAIVARRTCKIYIKNEAMFVKIESASLKSELIMRKSQIIAALNKKAGSELVKELIFL